MAGVVGVLRQRGRSKITGLLVEMAYAQVYTIREGMEVRMEMYADPTTPSKLSGWRGRRCRRRTWRSSNWRHTPSPGSLSRMSDADVQLVQSWAEQFAVAEDPLDWMYENMWAEDIDHRAIEGAPDDHGPIIGRDAMRVYLAEWFEMFPDLKIAFEDITDVGPGRVIVVAHLAGTAKASSVPTEIRVPVLWTIRDGKIVRGREYLTMDEALRAAGTAE